MKKNLPDFISNLSGNQFEVLDELFEKRYSECIELYWYIKDYIEQITDLTYCPNKRSSSLQITMKTKGIKSKTLIESLEEMKPDNCLVKLEDVGKEGIRISIKKKKKK